MKELWNDKLMFAAPCSHTPMRAPHGSGLESRLSKPCRSSQRAKFLCGVFLLELFFLRLFGQKEKWTNGFISQNCCNVSKKLVFSPMFFFSSFLAKEKKNQKEKTRFLRQWGVSPRARGDKGYAPLTGGTSPVRARIGVCEHGALNYNLSRSFIP